jgi:hypothetical protein
MLLLVQPVSSVSLPLFSPKQMFAFAISRQACSKPDPDQPAAAHATILGSALLSAESTSRGGQRWAVFATRCALG